MCLWTELDALMHPPHMCTVPGTAGTAVTQKVETYAPVHVSSCSGVSVEAESVARESRRGQCRFAVRGEGSRHEGWS